MPIILDIFKVPNLVLKNYIILLNYFYKTDKKLFLYDKNNDLNELLVIIIKYFRDIHNMASLYINLIFFLIISYYNKCGMKFF